MPRPFVQDQDKTLTEDLESKSETFGEGLESKTFTNQTREVISRSKTSLGSRCTVSTGLRDNNLSYSFTINIQPPK